MSDLSLHEDGNWVTVTCANPACGKECHINIPSPEDHTRAVTKMVPVTLPSGTSFEVEATVSEPDSSLLFECGHCDTKQRMEIKR